MTIYTDKPIKLDCGHVSTPSGCAAGMATSCVTGKTLCYCCAAEVTRGIMREEGKISGVYLTAKGFPRDPYKLVGFIGSKITTWDGTVLAENVYILSAWKNNFGDDRVAFRFRFDGAVWSGSGGGYGQSCHARRTKLKHLRG